MKKISTVQAFVMKFLKEQNQRDSALRLFSVWWWSTSVRWRVLRHAGGHAVARDDPAKVSSRPCAWPFCPGARLRHATSQARHPRNRTSPRVLHLNNFLGITTESVPLGVEKCWADTQVYFRRGPTIRLSSATPSRFHRANGMSGSGESPRRLGMGVRNKARRLSRLGN